MTHVHVFFRLFFSPSPTLPDFFVHNSQHIGLALYGTRGIEYFKNGMAFSCSTNIYICIKKNQRGLACQGVALRAHCQSHLTFQSLLHRLTKHALLFFEWKYLLKYILFFFFFQKMLNVWPILLIPWRRCALEHSLRFLSFSMSFLPFGKYIFRLFFFPKMNVIQKKTNIHHEFFPGLLIKCK